MTDREAFEAHWWITRGRKKAAYELKIGDKDEHGYAFPSTQRHWWTWQCAIRSQAAPVAAADPLMAQALEALKSATGFLSKKVRDQNHRLIKALEAAVIAKQASALQAAPVAAREPSDAQIIELSERDDFWKPMDGYQDRNEMNVIAFTRAAFALLAAQEHDPSKTITKVTDEMVTRFLSWRLPDDFNPDCGISFKRVHSEASPFGPSNHEPVGTNLLSAEQARKMLEHVLAVVPSAPKGEGS